VTQSLHDRGHGQALIGNSIGVGFPESVKFRFRYPGTLSNGLQLAQEVSLHTADGVGKDQIAGLGSFRNYPVP